MQTGMDNYLTSYFMRQKEEYFKVNEGKFWKILISREHVYTRVYYY